MNSCQNREKVYHKRSYKATLLSNFMGYEEVPMSWCPKILSLDLSGSFDLLPISFSLALRYLDSSSLRQKEKKFQLNDQSPEVRFCYTLQTWSLVLELDNELWTVNQGNKHVCVSTEALAKLNFKDSRGKNNCAQI